jgi:acetoin utilization deacetylase AcuC-like enzyme
MCLSDKDFAELTRIVVRIADRHAAGRLVSVLEGGYELEGLTSAVRAHVDALVAG